MHPELKAYLDEREAKAQARHDALLAKILAGVSTPQPARPLVTAADGGLTDDATVPEVVPDGYCFTAKAQEILQVAPDAPPTCTEMAPITCSTKCSTQFDAIVRVDEAHETATTTHLAPVVDFIHQEVEQLAPVQATASTRTSTPAPALQVHSTEYPVHVGDWVKPLFALSMPCPTYAPSSLTHTDHPEPLRHPSLMAQAEYGTHLVDKSKNWGLPPVWQGIEQPWPPPLRVCISHMGHQFRPRPWPSFKYHSDASDMEEPCSGIHSQPRSWFSSGLLVFLFRDVASLRVCCWQYKRQQQWRPPDRANYWECMTGRSFPRGRTLLVIFHSRPSSMYLEHFTSLGLHDSPGCIKSSVYCQESTTRASMKADDWINLKLSGTNYGATATVTTLLKLYVVAWSRTQRLSTGSKQKPCTARENYWAIVKSEVTQWMLPSVNCLFGNGIRLLPGQQRLSEFCACSFTTAPKLQYPYLATMAAHLFHSRQKTGALSTKLSSSIFLQFMQLGPHELGCCVIFFVQSSYDICAQDIQLRVGFSQKHVQPKPPYFSGDCRTVRVWSELFKTELPYKICFSVTNLCWPATTALGSVEYIGDLFLVLHEQSRKLDTTRNLVSKTQEHWNLSEHHILEHATACSIPMGDKLQRKIQLMTLSVHREIFSQGDFNRSVRFAREYNCDQPKVCCSTLNQAYHKLDNSISLSVEHPLSFTEPEPGVDACKHEQKAGDSSRVGVQLTMLVTFKCYSPFGTTMLWWQHSSSVYGTDHCNTLSALSGKNSIDDTVGTIHHMIWKPTGAELNQPVTHPGTYISLFQPKPPWPLQVIILAEFSFSGQQTNSESWHCSYCLCTILQKLSEHVHEPDGRSTVEDCNFAMHPALYHHQPFHRGTVTNWVVTMVQQHIIRTLFESSCFNDRQTSELPELDRLQTTTKHLHKSVHRQFLGKEAPEGGGTCMSANQIIGGKEVIITMQSTIINCCGKGQQSTMGVVKNEEWSFYHPCHNCPAALLGLRKRADLQLCQSIGSTKLCVLSTPGTPGRFTVVMKGYCISSCKELVQGGRDVLAVAACFAHDSVEGCNNYYFLGISFDSVAIVHDYYSHIVRVNPDRGNHRDLELVKDHQVQWDPGGSRWRRLGVKPNFKERGMLRALLLSPTWAGPWTS